MLWLLSIPKYLVDWFAVYGFTRKIVPSEEDCSRGKICFEFCYRWTEHLRTWLKRPLHCVKTAISLGLSIANKFWLCLQLFQQSLLIIVAIPNDYYDNPYWLFFYYHNIWWQYNLNDNCDNPISPLTFLKMTFMTIPNNNYDNP